VTGVQTCALPISPLYAREGYLFVTQPPEKETNVYRYQISFYEDSQEQLRSLNTEFLESVQKKPLYTYERIKLDLLARWKDMPNPATYLIDRKSTRLNSSHVKISYAVFC